MKLNFRELWKHRPVILHLRGTVLPKIWWQVLIMAVYTVIIACFHNFVPALEMKFPLTLVSVLGVVTGLLLVFRTNTAYARYWEGRCLWSKATVQIRHLTRLIWAGVEEKVDDEAENVKNVLEKTSAINLLVAFVYATKNYLREEYSYEEEDIKDLIGHLPRFRHLKNNQFIGTVEPSVAKNLKRKTVHYKQNEGNGGNIPNQPSTNVFVGSDGSVHKEKYFNAIAHENACPTNIPIEISFYIFSYVNNVVSKNLADGSATYFMYDFVEIGRTLQSMQKVQKALMTLIDCMTGFERILRTPIPLAYGVHLHQAVWLFLLALPYQLMMSLNWWSIPAVSLASFAFLGIMYIGHEIENPFGYDHNDLPLDDFCDVIKQEIQVIMGNPMPTLDSWIFSKDNFPLAPNSWLSAQELLKTPLDELRTILAKGAELDQEISVSGTPAAIFNNKAPVAPIYEGGQGMNL